MALANYVKFRRGTPASYEALATKDADSLYFISERNATQGVLYLGDKLITGSLTSSMTLSDLEDILLGNNITPNSILIYDGNEGKWVNKPFSEVFSEISASLVTMQGATADSNGAAGIVPTPLAGDQNKFLRGDATWADAGLTPQQAQELIQLRADVDTLTGEDFGSSMREVASEIINTIIADAPADLDTLKEVADWIADHSNSLIEIDTRIVTLETGVGNLEDEIAALHATDNDLQNQIDDLDMRLRWRRIDGSEEE